METFHRHFLSILLFENTNIKLDFPHLICERPPSIIIIIFIFLKYILQQGLSKPYDNLKDAFRCQSSLSVSRHKKSVNIKKGASVRNGQTAVKRALCSACTNMEAQQSLTLPSMQSEDLPGSPLGHAVCSKLDNTPRVHSRVGEQKLIMPTWARV